MVKKAFGLVGSIASGKGTVAKILEKKGFTSYSLSDRIREEILSRGLEITRPNLNSVSNELRKTFGADILAQRTVELVRKNNSDKVVIDAIRNPAEVRRIKETLSATIIGIVADQKKRYELFKNRGTNTAGIENFEQFKELDDRELAQGGEHKQQIQASLNLADILVENNGTLEELQSKIDELLI